MERAHAAARAIAAHDSLVAMVLALTPSPLLFCQHYGRARRPAPWMAS
ncbi:hypothetical protein [Mesorhizobium sp. M0013]